MVTIIYQALNLSARLALPIQQLSARSDKLSATGTLAIGFFPPWLWIYILFMCQNWFTKLYKDFIDLSLAIDR